MTHNYKDYKVKVVEKESDDYSSRIQKAILIITNSLQKNKGNIIIK